MIKAAFFDVDGTLLSHKTKSVPQSTRRAIEKLKAAGYNGLYSLEYTAPNEEKFKEVLEYVNSLI